MIAVMSTLQDKKVPKLPKFPIFEQYQKYQLKEIIRYTWFTQMCYLGFEVLAKVLSHPLYPILFWFHPKDII